MMEWYYDAFRVLSLLVVWAIPATLVAAVVVFTIFAPALTLTGTGINLYKMASALSRFRYHPKLFNDFLPGGKAPPRIPEPQQQPKH